MYPIERSCCLACREVQDTCLDFIWSWWSAKRKQHVGIFYYLGIQSRATVDVFFVWLSSRIIIAAAHEQTVQFWEVKVFKAYASNPSGRISTCCVSHLVLARLNSLRL